MPHTVFATYGGAVTQRSLQPSRAALGGSHYIRCLGPLLPLYDLELDRITFCEAFVSVGCDCTIVNKYIRSTLVPNKPKTFSIVKPLYGPF